MTERQKQRKLKTLEQLIILDAISVANYVKEYKSAILSALCRDTTFNLEVYHELRRRLNEWEETVLLTDQLRQEDSNV